MERAISRNIMAVWTATAPTPPPAGGGAAPRDAAAGEAAGAGAGEAGERADVSGASGEATGGDDDGDASMYKLQTCRARRARE